MTASARPLQLQQLVREYPFLRVVRHRARRGIADALRTGYLNSTGSVLVFYPAGRLMDRKGRQWVAIPSTLIMGAVPARIAGVRDPDEQVAQGVLRDDQSHPLHPQRRPDLTPPHRRPPSRFRPRHERPPRVPPGCARHPRPARPG